MRTLRQLCVESDTLCCRDQFFAVLGKMDDWEFEDVDLQNLLAEKDTGKRTRFDFLGPLGEFAPRQSPPPGSAAAGSGAAASSGPARPATGYQPTPLETIERLFKDEAQQQVELNERLRAAGYRTG